MLTEPRLEEGELLYSSSSSYRVMELVGEGGFGKVAKCFKADEQQIVAVKMPKEENEEDIENEVDVWTSGDISMLTAEYEPSPVKCLYHRDDFFLFSPQLAMLEAISVLDPDHYNVVRFYEKFEYRNHSFLAFEMLDMDLFDFMESHQWTPLRLHEIRPIVKQVCTLGLNGVLFCTSSSDQ